MTLNLPFRRPFLWGACDPCGCIPGPILSRRRHARVSPGLVAILVLGGSASGLAAQAGGVFSDPDDASEAFVHESWAAQDGLPVNSISALLQSRDGYVWIATLDGLVRFDGVRFTVFNSANSPELPSNRITDLVEARDGALWLRTEQGHLLRLRRGVFTHFGPEQGLEHGVFTVYEDPGGTLWIGTTQGLGFIRDERFVPVAPELIRGRVTAIVQRTDGTHWAGTTAGGLFSIENGRATPVAGGSALASEEITALHEDRQGTLWFGTPGATWRYGNAPELVRRTAHPRDFRTSPRTGELWVLTERQVYRQGAQGLAHVLDREVTSFRRALLLPDEAGRMLYTSGPELHREGRRLYSLLADSAGQSTAQAEITAITLDHEGSIWLGTSNAGLHRLKPAAFTVYSEREGIHRNVLGVYEDRAGSLWIGTSGGGTHRLAGGRITHLAGDEGYPAAARSFLQDRTGRLWIGGLGGPGLWVCARPGLRCAAPQPNPIDGAQVRAIHEEVSGALWFGTDGGLFRLEDGSWTRFTQADGAPSFPVRAFLQTRDGALWMGTNGGGLARYQRGSFRFVTTAEGLPLDLIRSLHQDEDGWLWIGTEGRGLARLDPREWSEGDGGGRIVSYRASDGLFDEVIHQILEDDDDRLWMSTNRGIFRVERRALLDFAEGKIPRINSTGYTERDGLRNREANGGSQPAGTRSRDGRLWFPTQDGVAVVDPARVEHNAIPPNVVIEQVTAGGMALRPGAGALELGVEQRTLEIEYTALSFLAPDNVRFRYRLVGYDDDWVEAGGRRTAYYTRVPPGRYTFRVLAGNNDGVWNEDGAVLALRLAPRFHETGAFRLLSLLALGMVVTGGLGWRAYRLRVQALELERLVTERTAELEREKEVTARQADALQEMDRAKSHFFANISHEFRTPLTLILGPLRDLAEGRRGRLSDDVHGQVDMMTRNAQRLQRLVNQVLDLARLESGTLALAPEPRDLVELARSLTRSFTPLAERRRIALAFHAQAERLLVRVDAAQMEKVLLNLLSNAFKFTEPGGEVAVRVRQEDGSAVVEVRDTGTGIAPEQLPRVFERFYQADGSATRRHEGTGIGLSLVKELVELHGGSVAAESRPGAGSTFRVRLPLISAEQQPQDAAAGPPLEHELLSPESPADGNGEETEEAATQETEDADRTTVLVVDDHADIRAYVRSILEPAYRVIEAADGLEGLECARAALPDLVLADVMMPRLDGFGLARGLREDPATDCIPIILLTARAAAEDEVQGLGTGADDYVAKPFHAEVLEARVSGLIASRRRLRERFRQEGLPVRAAPAVPDAVRSELEERLRALIEANLTEPDFNADALAAAAGLSYKQLYRRLAAELDSTPSRFIRMVRVERAAELLRDGAGSITEVAYSVGFNSLSYFYRCFHERFGLAPSAAPQHPG